MAMYTLHNFGRSSCSWRVRIALEWKGIPFAYRSVDFFHGEQQSTAFSAINPNQRIPALELPDGRVIAQSTAILEFLEEAHPGAPSLLPPLSDPFLRAQVRNLCGIIGSDTQPLQSLAAQAKSAEALPETERGAAKLAWAAHWIARGLAAFEAELSRCAGDFSVGDQVTLADVFLLPQLANARAAGVDTAAFPRALRIAERLEALPAFQRARPDAQPDGKPNTGRV